MPTAPNLPTSGITSGSTTGHITHTYSVHGVVNGIYKATIGTTRTTAFTITQAMSGEVIPVNWASSTAITVPVLEAGTSVEFVRLGAGAVTLTASGTTFVGSTTSPPQNSSFSLLWLTTTSVYVIGGA